MLQISLKIKARLLVSDLLRIGHDFSSNSRVLVSIGHEFSSKLRGFVMLVFCQNIRHDFMLLISFTKNKGTTFSCLFVKEQDLSSKSINMLSLWFLQDPPPPQKWEASYLAAGC